MSLWFNSRNAGQSQTLISKDRNGFRGRQTYTIHGSAVNLAARLEALNKDYGTRILVSARGAALCPRFALRRVADATIRGYAEPIALFTPVPESRDA